MKNTISFESLGIDVSSEELQIYLRENHQQGISKTFHNTDSGIKNLIEFLNNKNFNKKIVMESTGRYHGLCAVMLKEAGFEIYVVNPLSIKKYQTSRIRKIKTDKIDAKILAEVAVLEKQLSAFTMTREGLGIRQKISVLKSVEKQIQRIKATVDNYEKSITTLGLNLSSEENELKKVVKVLIKQKENLEKELIELISNHKKYHNQFNLVRKTPGISDFMACLIAFFYSLEKGDQANKWVAYTGMDISIAESGKWKGHGKLGKRGNKYLRKRWFSCSWGAVMNNEEFKKYYYELKEKGRSHKEALNIIARKLIRITYSILKTQQPFCFEKCF